MDFKYKITDVAKEFDLPAKKVIETVAPLTGETYKTGGTFGEKELDVLLETLTRANAETSMDAYLNSAKVQPEPKPEPKPEKKPAAKPAEKKAEPKPEAKPAEKKAEPKPEAKPAPKAEEPKKEARKPEKQAEKRSEKRVTFQELAADTGIKKPVAATEQVEVNRARVSVDTRTVDVNVDKFNARYDDLADSRNMPSKRKNQPTGKKEKFNNRNRQRGQQFGRRRETEAERLQRIQLEKARNAQLKISIPDEITVGELATRLKQSAAKVVAKFMAMGEMHAVSDVVDFDTAALIAEEFHAKVEHEVHVSIEERLFVQEEDNAEDLVERPPVVVVMGHVDHGKTSILDAIRKTNVTKGEAGGITQAIGAYQVKSGDSLITFLDTPGHEAFPAMRARGANMTDIAVLVVAADDGIMPQTIESINHAKAANVKLIVAINKMDKPTANPERVKEQLTKYEIVPEDWGGDVACIPVSAMTGMGISDLLERIALEAEVMELKANPNRRGKGAVVEARLDKGQGPIATLLVQNGTLHKGDCLIAGTAVGRVRTMRNDKGQEITEAGPSTPVEITGLTEVPEAGELFEAVEDERLARELADRRTTEAKEKQFAAYTKVTLDNLFDQMAANDMKELPIVVKADVQGSAEAVKQSLEKISNEEVRVRVIHTGVGAINESDILLASTAGAIIVGFNVRPDAAAQASGQRANVDMRFYRVIYDAIDEIEAAMKGMLAPKYEEVVIGHAEVRMTYKVSAVGTIAGCMVKDGKVTRDSKVRVLRDNIVIHEGEVGSLQRFKDAAKEVTAGFECGMSIAKFNDIREGDIFECYVMQEVKR